MIVNENENKLIKISLASDRYHLNVQKTFSAA